MKAVAVLNAIEAHLASMREPHLEGSDKEAGFNLCLEEVGRLVKTLKAAAAEDEKPVMRGGS